MEKLSINSSKKTLLAVALVIFMLVAFLGLAVLSSSGTFAQADTELFSAAFTAHSATAHTDSTTTKLYYNQLASGTGALPSAVNDTFDVTYTFDSSALSSASITAFEMDLANTGFTVTKIKINNIDVSDTTLDAISTAYTYIDSTNKVTYTVTNGFVSGGESRVIADIAPDAAKLAGLSTITVTYKLTAAIATYSNKQIYATMTYWNTLDAESTVTSNAVGVYVRSTTSITTTDPGKTYDASAATTSTTFTAAVSANKPSDPAITTVWKPAAGEYSSTAPTDAGSYYVKVSTPATDVFEASEYEDDFTISPKAITITADNKTSVYSTTPAALSYSYDPIDFYDRDGITVSYGNDGGSVTTATVVGSYTITPSASGTGIGNYTVTPVNGTYTVTRHHVAVPTVTIYNNGATTNTTIAAGTTEEKTFNGKAYSFNYTVDPTDANSNAIYTHGSTGADILNVGSSTLTLTVGDNYYWGAEGVAVGSQDTANKTFTIQVNKANITVYLHHTAITYRDAVPTTGYTLGDDGNGLLYGENLGSIVLTQGDFSTEYAVGDPVGTYDIEVAEDSDSRTAIENFLSNYNVSYDGEDQLSVGKLTVTADNTWIAYTDSASVTYDAAAHGIVAVPAKYTMSHSDTSAVICNVALTGGDNSNGTQTHVSGDEAAVTLTATFTLKGDSAKDDYNNTITENYTLAEGVQTKNVTITRKAINITANNKSITYGDAFANDGVTYGTFAGSETSAVLTGTLAYATDYVAEAENEKRVVGTYYIRPSGLSNNDYAITYVDGVLTVGKKTVSITWSTPNTWTYDGSSHIVTATIGATEYDEEIEVASYNTDTALTNVGSSSRSVTSLSDDDNYAIPENSQAFSVTARTVTVAVTPASNFTYDSDSHTIFTVAVSNLVGTESLTFAYTETGHDASGTSAVYKNGSYTFSGEWADTYTLVFTAISNGVAGDSQTAGAASNYTLSADIEKSMTIGQYEYSLGSFTYSDANTTGATISWVALTDLYSDGISFTYTVKKGDTSKQSSSSNSFATTESGTYTLDYAISGDRAANYAAIEQRTMTTLYVIELNDDDYADSTNGHPNHGLQHADIFIYAFAAQTLPVQTAWTEAGYIFDGWFYGESQFGNAGAAVSADAVYTAKWHPATYTVTYYYRLAGSSEFTEWKEKVTTYYTALDAAPEKTWFANTTGWHIAAIGGDVKTILDVTEDTEYYTEYLYTIGNGDVNGDGSVTGADATALRQYLAKGYFTPDYIKATVADAWNIVKDENEGPVAHPGYFLVPSANVNGDSKIAANDITAVTKAVVDGDSYDYDVVNNAVVKKVSAAAGTTEFAIGSGLTIESVKVNGEAATYSYTSDKLTLDTALAAGETLEIKFSRGAYVGFTWKYVVPVA